MEFYHLRWDPWKLRCYSQAVPNQEEDPALQSQSWIKDYFSLTVPHHKSDCRSTKLPPTEVGNCIKLPIKRKKINSFKGQFKIDLNPVKTQHKMRILCKVTPRTEAL